MASEGAGERRDRGCVSNARECLGCRDGDAAGAILQCPAEQLDGAIIGDRLELAHRGLADLIGRVLQVRTERLQVLVRTRILSRYPGHDPAGSHAPTSGRMAVALPGCSGTTG